jgi:Right handed beta helix region
MTRLVDYLTASGGISLTDNGSTFNVSAPPADVWVNLVPDSPAAAAGNTAAIKAALAAAAVRGATRPVLAGAAAGRGGGRVVLPAGQLFYVAEDGTSGVRIVGLHNTFLDLNRSFLRAPDNTSTDAHPVSMFRPDVVSSFVGIGNGFLIGGSQPGDTTHVTHGVDYTQQAAAMELYDCNHYSTNLLAFGFSGWGFNCFGFANTAKIVNCSAYNNYRGFHLKTDQLVVNCVAGTNTLDGFFIENGTNCQVTNCKAFGGTNAGYTLQGCSGIHFTNCQAEDVGLFGFDIDSSNDVTGDIQILRCGSAGNLAAVAVKTGCTDVDLRVNARAAGNLFGSGLWLGTGGNVRIQAKIIGASGGFVNDTTSGATNGVASNSDLVINNEQGNQPIAYAASITPNIMTGGIVTVGVLTGNITVNNPIDGLGGSGHVGSRMTFHFTQDATGSRTVTWGTNFDTNGGAGAWIMPPAAGTTGSITFVRNAAGKFVRS